MLTKYGVDPMAQIGGRLAKRRTVLLSPRIEGATADEHDLQEQPGAWPHHSTTIGEQLLQAAIHPVRSSTNTPTISRRSLQEGNDARALPPPKDLGFHPRRASWSAAAA
jgi:hypothetical protein